MQLPINLNNLLIWVDPSEKYIYRNYTTNKVSAVKNRIKNGLPIAQSNPTLQPTWNSTIMNGLPGLVFTSTNELTNGQKLTMALDSALISNKPLIMSAAIAIGSTGTGDVVSSGSIPIEIGSSTLGNGAGGEGFGMIFFAQFPPNPNTGQIYSYIFGDPNGASGNGFTTSTTLDTNIKIYTLIWDNSTQMTLRINGQTIGTSPFSNFAISSYTLNSFALGADNYPSGAQYYFNGNIGQVVVYQGSTTDFAVEDYLMKLYGISHTPLG